MSRNISGMRYSLMFLMGAVACATVPLATAADSFTVGVLSCAAETDRDRRLECYDRAVAVFTAGLSSGKHESSAAPAAAVSGSGAAAGYGSKSTPPDSSVAIAPTATPPAAAAVSAPARSATQPPEATARSTAPSTARHSSAHIASIEHFPDYVVVHLDNQQTWKQVSDSPGANMLRTGDAVTIDKEMGSYWLAGPKGESVQVRLEH